jgi:hypothetical protein
MNAGAARARGRALFFLHADSFPPSDALALIGGALADPRAVGGAFEHRFAEPVWSLRAITAINRVRDRLTRNYDGDQGQFVRTPLVTSGRRFLARGPWRTFFFSAWLLALWTLGLDTERYAERWRGPAGRTPGTPWPGPEATRPS